MMKHAFFLLLFLTPALAVSIADSISGKVEVNPKCSKKVMVWLSLDKENYQERLLLMHTEVPQGGSFKFYVKPGAYQVRGSDEAGCEYLQKVNVKERNLALKIKMVKK
jgi:hypothetical protein